MKEEEEARAALLRAIEAEKPSPPWVEDEEGDEENDSAAESSPKESFFSKFVSGYQKATSDQVDKIKDKREEEKILGNVVSDWASAQISDFLQREGKASKAVLDEDVVVSSEASSSSSYQSTEVGGEGDGNNVDEDGVEKDENEDGR